MLKYDAVKDQKIIIMILEKNYRHVIYVVVVVVGVEVVVMVVVVVVVEMCCGNFL
jgi:hypothetical protein